MKNWTCSRLTHQSELSIVRGFTEDRVVIGLKSGCRLWIFGLSLNAANRPSGRGIKRERLTHGVDVVTTTGGFTERLPTQNAGFC